MSYDILVQDLHRKSRERIEKIWAEARHKADEFRVEKIRVLEKERKTTDFLRQEIARDVAAPILLEAEKKGIMIEDDARRKLVARLYRLAEQFLGLVREGDYEKVFSGLVDELPEVLWQTVRVNPLDRELAVHFFAGAEVVADKDIAGGFEAVDTSGKYRVVSTLEKRLERAWSYALPFLLQEFLEKDDAPIAP